MILFCNVKRVVEEFLAQFLAAQISCPTHFIELSPCLNHIEQVRF
jgi:hypothetical protein